MAGGSNGIMAPFYLLKALVTEEELEALDFTIWWRTGQRAALALNCNQSTISRRVRSCLQVFGLQLERCGGEWELLGDSQLLALERQVHQLLRLIRGGPLRLEASDRAGPLLARPAPPGWITGCFDHVGMARPLQLLRERVIDVWLASDQSGLPDPDDPDWAVFDLKCRLAPQLVSLDSNLQPCSGEALVVCRPLAEQEEVLRLLETLRQRAAELAARDPHQPPSAA